MSQSSQNAQLITSSSGGGGGGGGGGNSSSRGGGGDMLFACSRCYSRHPFEELSSGQQLCKVRGFCLIIMLSSLLIEMFCNRNAEASTPSLSAHTAVPSSSSPVNPQLRRFVKSVSRM